MAVARLSKVRDPPNESTIRSVAPVALGSLRGSSVPEKRSKVLIVDDSEVCREAVRLALESRGHRVIAMSSPFGLNRMMDAVRPDLLLMDVSMPEMNGDKVVRILLDHQHHRCPVVFYSDRSETELGDLVVRTGASGFILKTPDLDQLAESIEHFFDSFERKQRPEKEQR